VRAGARNECPAGGLVQPDKTRTGHIPHSYYERRAGVMAHDVQVTAGYMCLARG